MEIIQEYRLQTLMKGRIHQKLFLSQRNNCTTRNDIVTLYQRYRSRHKHIHNGPTGNNKLSKSESLTWIGSREFGVIIIYYGPYHYPLKLYLSLISVYLHKQPAQLAKLK